MTASDDDFFHAASLLIEDQSVRRAMSLAARKRAERASWDAVFDSVYAAYGCELTGCGKNQVLKGHDFSRAASRAN